MTIAFVHTVERIIVPAAVMIIMFCLGSGLQVRHFVQTFRQPRLLGTALTCQLVILPALAISFRSIFAMDPAIAAGLVLIAACPSSAPANLLTRLARANVSLSVGLTALTNLLATVTIPVFFAFAGWRGIESRVLSVQLLRMAAGLCLLSALPVLLGMAARHLRPRLIERYDASLSRIAGAAFVLGMTAAIALAWNRIAISFVRVGYLAVLLNVCGATITYVIARISRCEFSDRVAVTLSSSTRSFNMATFVAITLLIDEEIWIPSIAYCLVMWPTALLIVLLARSAPLTRRVSPVHVSRPVHHP